MIGLKYALGARRLHTKVNVGRWLSILRRSGGLHKGIGGDRTQLVGAPGVRFLSKESSESGGRAEETVRAGETGEDKEGEKEENGEGDAKVKGQSLVAMDDEYDDYEYDEPRTAADRMNDYFVLAMQLTFFGCLLAGAGVALKELFPGRMRAQNLYSEAYDALQLNDDVVRICGEDMRAFGRDTGSESRRSLVDEREYMEADGSKRVRIRFNIKGSKGHVKVWAEASDKMGANEWVYLIIQNQRSGKVMTIEDERDRLQREMLLNKDKGDMQGTGSQLTDSISQLLRGGGGGSSTSSK